MITEQDWIEKMIAVIEARPILYNQSVPEYNNKDLRNKAWREVFEQVVDNWHMLTPSERNLKGSKLRERWKNLRTCFARELRIQKKLASCPKSLKRRRKYLYYDHLKFLIPTLEVSDTVSSGHHHHHHSASSSTHGETLEVEDSKFHDDDNNDDDDNDYEEDLGSLKQPRSTAGYTISTLNTTNGTTASAFATANSFSRPTTSFNSSTTARSNSRKSRRKPTVASSLSSEDLLLTLLRDKGKEEKIDEDKMFLMSLLPALKRLDYEQKFDVKIEIMQVLSRYHRSGHPQQVFQSSVGHGQTNYQNATLNRHEPYPCTMTVNTTATFPPAQKQEPGISRSGTPSDTGRATPASEVFSL